MVSTINRLSHDIDLRETTVNASGLILSLVKEAAVLGPCVELKQAAVAALMIFETIQVCSLKKSLVIDSSIQD